jgi:hypothetical protein
MREYDLDAWRRQNVLKEIFFRSRGRFWGHSGTPSRDRRCIKPHECGFWGSRNTRVMRSRGFPGQRPSRVCFCSLGNRYADVATTSRWPVQQYAWCHWDSAMTLMQRRKSIYHMCCIWYFYTTPGYHSSIAGLHGSNFVSFLRNISRWW